MTDRLVALWQPAIEAMEARPVLLIFVVLGLGHLIGRFRIGGFSLGAVAGVLFAGIFFGHFGLRVTPGAQAFGFALFIFSVGYQAGPKFFSAVRRDGIKYLALALVVALSGALTTLAAASLLDADPGVEAGLLAGGLTSAATLAAAQDAVRHGTVPLPAEWDSDTVISNVATAFAITYVFGLTSLISLVALLPRLLGIDLAAECQRLEHHQRPDITPPPITTRCYRVEAGGIGNIGPEIPPSWDIEQATDTAHVIVTNKAVLGRTLGELNIPQSFGVLITQITQMGVQMPHGCDQVLQKGDILQVVGPANKINLVGNYMGQIERPLHETDMVTFAFGIAAGVLLGMVSVTVGGLELGLGNAGGLLVSGLIIGYLRSVRPTFGRLPEGARWLLMEFGLLLFIAAVGLRAGGNIIATVISSGPGLILSGIVVTTLTVSTAYLFGSHILKLSPPILLGAIAGAMTSGASLNVLTNTARSAIPAIGYAGTYAFGSVLLMVAALLVMLSH